MITIRANDRIETIGYQTENNRTQVLFDLSDVMEEFPGGLAVLTVKRPLDDEAYPAIATEMEDTDLVWTVQDYDLAQKGILSAQVVYAVDNVVAKKKIYKFEVDESLINLAEEPPEWEDFVNSLLEAASGVNAAIEAAKDTLDEKVSEAEDARDQAVTAAGHYPRIIYGNWYVWDVQNGTYIDAGIKAEGVDGEDGYSPTVVVVPIPHGHRVIITDENGPHTFDVLDGDYSSVDYHNVINKPSIGGVTLDGNKTIGELGGLPSTEKGVANGVASLGADGKVPDIQLPSSMNNVRVYSTRSQLPAVGESNIIYIIATTSKIYGWFGSNYIELSPTLALGETSDTAYRGDRGKYAYDKVSAMNTATAADIDKCLSPKTVDSNGNVTEWQFVDGGGDLNTKADKTDTVLNTTLSRGRKAGSTVGTGSFAFGDVVAASGHYSHAEGVGSSSDIQYGYNHLKNDNSIGRITFSGSPGAKGYGSHAEGYASLPYDSFAHAEGYATYAGGYASHAEGNSTYASGVDSHAEGYQTTANGQNSHAEGSGTIASDVDAHAEGTSTVASHPGAHAEGYRTRALDDHTHSEGESTIADNNAAHAEGSGTYAGGYAAHAEGGRFASGDTKAIDGQVYRYGATGGYSHSEGTDTISYGQNSHAEGSGTSAIGEASHTEGAGTKATSTNAHAEGASTTASGTQAHAEGAATTASGVQSHAEGVSTTASGTQAHAEGSGTRATNASAHSEGSGTEASGLYSHAEGGGTHATGVGSHSEGASTYANGDLSHAEGNSAHANGVASHAEGYNTVANAQYSHVSGQYNVPDDYTNWSEWVANTSYVVGDKRKRTTTENNETVVKGYVCRTANSDSSFDSSKWVEDSSINYAVIVGNGAYNNPSNAYSLDWDGNGHFKGDVYVGCNADGTGGTKLGTGSQINFASDEDIQAIIDAWEVSA